MENSLLKYPAYKDSGVEWLGEIPQHWEVKRFRNNFKLGKGLTITKENLSDEGIFCVNYGEIHSKYGFEVNSSIHKLRCVSEEYLVSSPNSLIYEGDFIFADTSEDIDGSGNFTCVWGDNKVFAGYHTIIARPKNELNSRFLSYLFDSLMFRRQIQRGVNGVKVYSITQTILKRLLIWLPSDIEQTAIANFLDQKTALIEQAIAIKEKQIELLKERRQILIHQAVTKGLDKNVKLKDSGVEWIGEIPEGWEVKKLKYFSKIKSGDSIVNENLKDDGEFEVYGGNGFMGYNNKFNVQNQNIIIGRVGAYCGNIRLINEKKWISDNALILILTNESDYNYISIVLSAGNLNSLNSSNAQPLITGTKVMNFALPLPSKIEKEEILKFVETATTKISIAISLKEKEIEKLKEYKASLINSAVTGKIKVC
jgi:type I restriction enzyme S subunit